MESWDVVIVGGGPSGTSTALHLAREGWAKRILILEKARYPRHKLCGGGITEYGVACLSRIGLDIDDITNVPIHEMRMVRGKRTASFWQKAWLRIVRRDEMDAWLGQKAIAAGVAVHQGETVIDVTPHAQGVTVRTSDATYDAKTLVVADGSTGNTRRKLGIDDSDRVARVMEILTPVEDAASQALFENKVAVFDFSPSTDGLQGYYWDFPCVVRGKPCINRGVYDARTAPGRERADLKAILGDYLARRDIDIAKVDLMGCPIRWYAPDAKVSLPHVVLVGDAAGADPLIGEGIAFALGYGAIAAEAIIDAFAREDFAYVDYAARVLASDYGKLLNYRVTEARRLYRQPNPLVVPSFMPGLSI